MRTNTRLFKMTAVAQQALWTKCGTKDDSRLSTRVHIPVYFLVKGDAQDGYRISAVDENMAGFYLTDDYRRISTLYCCKRIIEQINETGDSDMRRFFSVGTFAWRHIPMPRVEQSLYKVLDSKFNRKHYPALIGWYLTSPPAYCGVKQV